MIKYIYLLVLGVMVFGGFSVQAEIYRWVDQDTGTVVYSDNPVKGATRVKLRGSAQSSHSQATRSSSKSAAKAVSIYKSLSIISPANNIMIRDNAGNIPVSLGVSPALKAGHTVILTFDGEDIRLDSTRFIIKDVDKGNHQLSARVVDKSGKTLLSSKISRFSLQRK